MLQRIIDTSDLLNHQMELNFRKMVNGDFFCIQNLYYYHRRTHKTLPHRQIGSLPPIKKNNNIASILLGYWCPLGSGILREISSYLWWENHLWCWFCSWFTGSLFKDMNVFQGKTRKILVSEAINISVISFASFFLLLWIQ